MTSLVHAVNHLKQTSHVLKSVRFKISDKWCHRLSRDLKLVLVEFMDVSSLARMLVVHSTWYRLRTDERFCRLAYTKWFGECTSRDMDIFEFDENTSWVCRLDVRIATMKNWLCGVATTRIFQIDSMTTCNLHLNGSRLSMDTNWPHGVQLDLHTGEWIRDVKWLPPTRCILRNPDHEIAMGDHWDGVHVRIRSKSTGQKVVQLVTPIAQFVHRIECDPMQDIMRIRTTNFNWHTYDIVSGKRLVSWDLHEGPQLSDTVDHGTSMSMLFDGNIYHPCPNDPSKLDVIDALTTQTRTSRAPVSNLGKLYAIIPRFLVFTGQDQIDLWDRASLKHKFTMMALDALVDISSRECLVIVNESIHQSFMHIDLNGVMRFFPSCTGRLMVPWAFNGRWLVADYGHGIEVYDFMPRRRRLLKKGCKI